MKCSTVQGCYEPDAEYQAEEYYSLLRIEVEEGGYVAAYSDKDCCDPNASNEEDSCEAPDEVIQSGVVFTSRQGRSVLRRDSCDDLRRGIKNERKGDESCHLPILLDAHYMAKEWMQEVGEDSRQDVCAEEQNAVAEVSAREKPTVEPLPSGRGTIASY